MCSSNPSPVSMGQAALSPQYGDANTVAAADKERERLAKIAKENSTILTSPTGVQGSAATTKSTLLG